MSNLTDFIEYLKEQVGQPYLWGGQHTKLTTENYEQVVDKCEKRTGGYPNMTYAEAAKRFCKKKFDAGATVLYAYDCSGLGVYWLYNLKKLYKMDVNSNTMASRCVMVPRIEAPKKGYWLFRENANGRVSHVGYMISDTECIHAEGRRTGVVRVKFKERYWHKWGIPFVFKDEITGDIKPVEPESPDTPPVTYEKKVKVVGGSVNVRADGYASSKRLGTAHRGDTFPYLGLHEKTGWYKILYKGQEAYISNIPKYTQMIDA